MEFKDLGLHPDIMRGVEEAGFVTCTPVQAAVYPEGFSGRDIYAQSQTGTGKTAAFLLSIFQRILTVPELRTRKVLVLAPTRELAVQIEDETAKLGKYINVSAASFYGGVGYGPQVDALRNNVQVMIGTPGRIIDLVKQGKMLLKDVGFLVIDEADRMFDMGFIDDLRKLIRYLPPPSERQTFLFSATLGLRVKDLAWEYMDSPHEILIEPEKVTVELVSQELYHVGAHEKMSLLLGILEREKPESAIIFANQKVMVEELARRLKINGVDCEYIMGDLPQSKRLEIIDRLKAGELKLLVATDVAARGLDIKGLDLVINYDLPDDTESYVHRIGRTARAGESGKAITLACERFVFNLPSIEKFIGIKIPVAPFDSSLLVPDKSEGMRLRRYPEERGRDAGRGRSPREGGRRGDSRHAGPERPRGPGRGSRKPLPEAERGRDELPVGDSRREDQRRGPRPERGSSRGLPRSGARDGAQSATPRNGRPAEAGQEGNPYAMSQDERLKRLKERYAGPAAQEGKGGKRGERRSEATGGTEGGKPESRGPQRGRKPARANEAAGSRPDGRGGAQNQQSRAAAPSKTREEAPKPGLLQRLKAFFTGKKES